MKQMINILLAALLATFRISAWAHQDIKVEANKVFTVNQSDIDLATLKDRVINDQLDIEISYQRLVQAQKRIAEARAQYFPYGLGTIAAFYFLNAWSPLLLVELVTSLPSKIYQVQSEKNMRTAQYYSHQAVKENIKNQVATLYYSMLKEETGLFLAGLEVKLLEDLLKVYEDQLAVGMVTLDEVKKVEYRLLDLRDIVLRFEGYLAEEKAAFNLLMGAGPEAEFNLKPVTPFLASNSLRLSSEEIVQGAFDRAPEITAAQYRIQAARRSKSSVKWSILSFSGIGFGYYARIQVAGSKVEQASIEKSLTEANIKSAAMIGYTKYNRSLGHFLNEVTSLNATEVFLNGEREMYDTGVTSLDRLVEVELLYLKDFSEWAISHYDALIRLDDLSRVYLGNLEINQLNTVH
ncbi:MAG: TolC family protein [Bacteriovoracaceae bacterium]|nr:TolC family protein [Bacteriovoracaceae bacterium]